MDTQGCDVGHPRQDSHDTASATHLQPPATIVDENSQGRSLYHDAWLVVRPPRLADKVEHILDAAEDTAWLEPRIATNQRLPCPKAAQQVYCTIRRREHCKHSLHQSHALCAWPHTEHGANTCSGSWTQRPTALGAEKTWVHRDRLEVSSKVGGHVPRSDNLRTGCHSARKLDQRTEQRVPKHRSNHSRRGVCQWALTRHDIC